MAWSLATGALGVFTDRPRLIGSAAVALLILGAAALKKLDDWPRSRVSDYLGQISYSTFLVHFPLCLVLNAAYTKFAAPDPWTALGTMVGAWLVSLCGAMLFHHQVEARLVGLGAKEPPAAKPAVPPALVRPEPG
jgi:peptidoglycan/LPS O-acetylase OafA/YrhL